MSKTASGAAKERAYDPYKFDPFEDVHFGLSQQTEFELRELLISIGTIGDLVESQPGDQPSDLEPKVFAPILRSLSRLGERLIAEKQTVFPKQRTMQ